MGVKLRARLKHSKGFAACCRERRQGWPCCGAPREAQPLFVGTASGAARQQAGYAERQQALSFTHILTAMAHASEGHLDPLLPKPQRGRDNTAQGKRAIASATLGRRSLRGGRTPRLASLCDIQRPRSPAAPGQQASLGAALCIRRSQRCARFALSVGCAYPGLRSLSLTSPWRL